TPPLFARPPSGAGGDRGGTAPIDASGVGPGIGAAVSGQVGRALELARAAGFDLLAAREGLGDGARARQTGVAQDPAVLDRHHPGDEKDSDENDPLDHWRTLPAAGRVSGR